MRIPERLQSGWDTAFPSFSAGGGITDLYQALAQSVISMDTADFGMDADRNGPRAVAVATGGRFTEAH